jgi:hypothetical protein
MTSRSNPPDSRKPEDGLVIPKPLVKWVHFLAALAIVWIVLSIQYIRYGLLQPLGWDTIAVAARAARILREGPIPVILEMNQVNLYYHIVAVGGWVSGSTLVAQMVIPAILIALLAVTFGVLSKEMFGSDHLALLTALIAVPLVGTLRLLNDLHRATLAYLLALMLLLLISKSGWVRSRRRNAVLLFGLTFALAFAELEVYVVYVGTALLGILVIWSRTRSESKRELITILSATFAPGLATFLIFPAFYLGYFPSFVIPDYRTVILPQSALAFSGYVALPLVIIGMFELVRRYVSRNKALGLYLSIWTGVLAGIFLAAVVGLIRLNPERPLLLLPIPVLIMAGAFAVYQVVKSSRFLAKRAHKGIRQTFVHLTAVALAAIILLAIYVPAAGFLEKSLRPHVPDWELQRIRSTAEILHEAGLSDPIIVFYGSNYLWKSDVIWAHVYLEVGDFLPYYGKLMYLLTEPEFVPGNGTRFTDDRVSQLGAIEYNRTTLAAVSALQSRVSILNRTLLILSPGLYTLPLSEPFLSRFESQDGVWILPPGSLTTQDFNAWRWFAYADYSEVSKLRIMGIPWGVTNIGLLLEGGQTPVSAQYRFSIFNPGMYQLRIHYEFPDLGSLSDQAWVEIDGVRAGELNKTSSPDWAELELFLDPELHHEVKIVLSSDSGAELVLDVIELSPL